MAHPARASEGGEVVPEPEHFGTGTPLNWWLQGFATTSRQIGPA